VVPWKCATDASGRPVGERVRHHLADHPDTDWAAANGISLDTAELVTGEHSGLKIFPAAGGQSNLVPRVARPE